MMDESRRRFLAKVLWDHTQLELDVPTVAFDTLTKQEQRSVIAANMQVVNYIGAVTERINGENGKD